MSPFHENLEIMDQYFLVHDFWFLDLVDRSPILVGGRYINGRQKHPEGVRILVVLNSDVDSADAHPHSLDQRQQVLV